MKIAPTNISLSGGGGGSDHNFVLVFDLENLKIVSTNISLSGGGSGASLFLWYMTPKM